MRLINGRGLIGIELSKHIPNDLDVDIYHTWNLKDKSNAAQKDSYEKFIKYVNNNNDRSIVFLSTDDQSNRSYCYYKQMSESYLLQNNEKGVVIRFPMILESDILKGFRDDKLKPYGEIEVITLEDAVDGIIEICSRETGWDDLSRYYNLKGEVISAKFAYNLIKFGIKNEN